MADKLDEFGTDSTGSELEANRTIVCAIGGTNMFGATACGYRSS